MTTEQAEQLQTIYDNINSVLSYKSLKMENLFCKLCGGAGQTNSYTHNIKEDKKSGSMYFCFVANNNGNCTMTVSGMTSIYSSYSHYKVYYLYVPYDETPNISISLKTPSTGQYCGGTLLRCYGEE